MFFLKFFALCVIVTPTLYTQPNAQTKGKPSTKKGTFQALLFNRYADVPRKDLLALRLFPEGKIVGMKTFPLKKEILAEYLQNPTGKSEGKYYLLLTIETGDSLSLNELQRALEFLRESVPPGETVIVFVVLNAKGLKIE